MGMRISEFLMLISSGNAQDIFKDAMIDSVFIVFVDTLRAAK